MMAAPAHLREFKILLALVGLLAMWHLGYKPIAELTGVDSRWVFYSFGGFGSAALLLLVNYLWGDRPYRDELQTVLLYGIFEFTLVGACGAVYGAYNLTSSANVGICKKITGAPLWFIGATLLFYAVLKIKRMLWQGR